MDRIAISQLTAGSVFKVGYFCLLGIFLPFFILCGLLAMAGSDVVSVNGRYVHGVEGLVAAVVMAFIFPAIFAGFMVLGALVMRLFARLLPGLSLRGETKA